MNLKVDREVNMLLKANTITLNVKPDFLVELCVPVLSCTLLG